MKIYQFAMHFELVLVLVSLGFVVKISLQEEIERYPLETNFYDLHPEGRHININVPDPILFNHPHDTAVRIPLHPIFFPYEENHLHISKTSPFIHKRVVSIVPLGFPKIDKMENSYPWLPDVQFIVKKDVKKSFTVTRDQLEYLLLDTS